SCFKKDDARFTTGPSVRASNNWPYSLNRPVRTLRMPFTFNGQSADAWIFRMNLCSHLRLLFRRAELRDASECIPGMGGIVDRIGTGPWSLRWDGKRFRRQLRPLFRR